MSICCNYVFKNFWLWLSETLEPFRFDTLLNFSGPFLLKAFKNSQGKPHRRTKRRTTDSVKVPDSFPGSPLISFLWLDSPEERLKWEQKALRIQKIWIKIHSRTCNHPFTSWPDPHRIYRRGGNGRNSGSGLFRSFTLIITSNDRRWSECLARLGLM